MWKEGQQQLKADVLPGPKQLFGSMPALTQGCCTARHHMRIIKVQTWRTAVIAIVQRRCGLRRASLRQRQRRPLRRLMVPGVLPTVVTGPLAFAAVMLAFLALTVLVFALVLVLSRLLRGLQASAFQEAVCDGLGNDHTLALC